MKWVVVHDGWHEGHYEGYFRTYYVRPGYFSDRECKKMSWIRAKLIAREYPKSTTFSSDRYFVKRAEEVDNVCSN